MCTAITYQTHNFYFGRTLDYDEVYPSEITITPRKFPLPFRSQPTIEEHFAILGMAYVLQDYPLYFDACNEKGLAMAGLNFVGFANYFPSVPGKDNIAQFELIPWILSQCSTVKEARTPLSRINLTTESFHPSLPPAQLHWIIADRTEAITVESLKTGIQVYDNSIGVLTNNPPFDDQLFQLKNYMHLSASEPHNHFSPNIDLQPYSRGMGAIGLPGDLSSQSRFVRAAFNKLNAVSDHTEAASVSQFFHILGTVEQTKGCCRLGDNQYETTLYTSCCNVSKGIYYYTTYENRQITAIHMRNDHIKQRDLIRYPLIREQMIHHYNTPAE